VLQKIIVVPRPLTERIKELRQEIAELTEKNRRYSLGPKETLIKFSLSTGSIDKVVPA